MRVFLVIWYRCLYPLWNLIPSTIHSLRFDKTEGKKVLRALRQRASRAKDVGAEMDVFGFTESVGPIRGPFSMRQKAWVTCARKTGNCEDFARLWVSILKHPRGEVEYLYTRSNSGKDRLLALYTMGGVCWLLSGPKVIGEVFEREKSELFIRYFGKKTDYSLVY